MSIGNQHSPDQIAKDGLNAFRRGDYPTAIQLYSEASTGYAALGNHLLAAEMANNLSVCYLKAGDTQKALDVVDGTDALFAEAGDVHRQAIALGNQAAALEGLGKYNQAVEKYEASSRLLKQAGALEDRATVLQSLSELHLKMGHQLDAMGTMQIALLNKKKLSFFDRILKKLLKIPFGS